ncbi:hypothetical protein VNO77_01898 [Canavalia gladiata]|uniref:Secreted protein n=1 Tax=Canavalia gladiata TaxID=3824 RepID=A0AAN9R2J3_CANGL
MKMIHPAFFLLAAVAIFHSSVLGWEVSPPQSLPAASLESNGGGGSGSSPPKVDFANDVSVHQPTLVWGGGVVVSEQPPPQHVRPQPHVRPCGEKRSAVLREMEDPSNEVLVGNARPR